MHQNTIIFTKPNPNHQTDLFYWNLGYEGQNFFEYKYIMNEALVELCCSKIKVSIPIVGY